MIELNLDGLVGPTHLFQGLSFGNVASTTFEGTVSSPKNAALQGLEKMWFLAKRGVKQGFLPPQTRPRVDFLKSAGFIGSDKEILLKAYNESPELLAIASSSSSMWAANSATISYHGGKVHITAANLKSMPHRSLEVEETKNTLKKIFPGDSFVHHNPLPCNLPDEGAANHMRLFGKSQNVEIFVYGRRLLEKREIRFPARHPLETSQSIARLHGLEAPLFFRQSDEAIEAGAFHNDVVATSFENFLLFHEKAYQEPIIETIVKSAPFANFYEVKEEQLSLKEAVTTYLFNSQIVRTSVGSRLFLAPLECQSSEKASKVIQDLQKKGFIDEIHFIDLTESMQNGGGPACLRLRVPLSEEAFRNVNRHFLLDEVLYCKLREWIEKHYREKLTLAEIPYMIEETEAAMKALQKLLIAK